MNNIVCQALFSFVSLSGEVKKSLWKMTIAVGVLFEIILVAFVGREKVFDRLQLYGQVVDIVTLHLVIDLLDGQIVFWVNVVDTCTVAGTTVLTLLVDAGGLDAIEVKVD